MRAFSLSSVAFLLLGSLIYAGLSHVSSRVAPIRPTEMLRQSILDRRGSLIEALAIGNSHGHAIDFDSLGVVGFHAWMGGQDLFEVEAHLDRLLPQLPALRVVLMPIAFASLSLDNSIQVSTDRSQHRRFFYWQNPSLLPIGPDVTHLVAGKLLSVVREDHWRKVFTVLYRDFSGDPLPVCLPVAEDGFIHQHEADEWTDPKVCTGMIPRALRRQTLLQNEMLASHPDLVEDCYAALLRSARKLEARGIELVLFGSPLVREYREGIDADSLGILEQTLARLQQETGLEYHDFSDDPLFADSPELFFDLQHLNRNGAARFSRERLLPLLPDDLRTGSR